MEPGAIDYVAVFAVTAAMAWFLTPLALRWAVRKEILDHPSEIKAQESPVPYLGGLAIVGSFAVVVLAAAIIRPPNTGLDQLTIILGLGVLLAVMGLFDDLRGLSPWLRLGVEIAAGVVVWATPAGAVTFQNDALNLLVTVAWIVFVTNALNLLDNMDGLSAGVSSVSALFIFAVALDNGQFLVATLSIAIAGCALGFLRSNFHPARIYMGDAGTLFLGFTLAVLTLKLDVTRAPKPVALIVPILLIGVPIFDTIVVTVSRLVHKRSPIIGGRDHTSHRLVFVGLPVRVAVGANYVAAASLGTLALVLSRQDLATGAILVGWILTIALTMGVLLARIPVYETSHRRHLMLQEVKEHQTEPLPGIVKDPEAEAS